ncbi:hypothetical protein CC86DRAFT_17220 [Ophiobolus disseminans]|uniref:Uncharacterized protein n=1 Tax=Ophiobolus disseminans TaxID=1469910 RepID=A0A6A7AMW6_9PLEO|nr:hypothetical protein CC86DRAFT_17220 [Ophiobolus disseminans]
MGPGLHQQISLNSIRVLRSTSASFCLGATVGSWKCRGLRPYTSTLFIATLRHVGDEFRNYRAMIGTGQGLCTRYAGTQFGNEYRGEGVGLCSFDASAAIAVRICGPSMGEIWEDRHCNNCSAAFTQCACSSPNVQSGKPFPLQVHMASTLWREIHRCCMTIYPRCNL